MSKNKVEINLDNTDDKQSAVSWDRVYAEGKSLLVWPDEMFVRELNSLPQTQNLKAMDIGCGAGRHTLLMAEAGMTVKGIDSSEASVKMAKKRAADRDFKNVTFENVPLQKLEEKDGGFDIIVAWGVIHYLSLEDQGFILTKIYQLLKPGGLFLATLRSTRDSRCDESHRVSSNRYRAKYFDADTASEKQMVMSFWNEPEVRSMLAAYQHVFLGHRDLEPIGENRASSSHWLIRAHK